jgi:hypothetical protein
MGDIERRFFIVLFIASTLTDFDGGARPLIIGA